MKWIWNWEKRLFPNESAYQRGRRRSRILLSVVGAVVVIVGAMIITNYLSEATGRPAKYVRPIRAR